MTTYHPIESKEEKNSKEETIWCDCCLNEENKKVAAISYCQDCNENQCEECDSIHKNKKFKNHVRTNLKQNNYSADKCLIHQNSKLTRYCKNCQKLICDKCIFDHSNHETISFDQPIDFYKELIREQKNCTQNHFQRINENFEQLNNSEKQMNKKKEDILNEISEFYLEQKKLLDLLEYNEKKLTNDFFKQISKIMKKEKQTMNDSKSSTKTLLNQYKELETKINQSNSFEFFKLFSQIELAKNEENQNLQFPRLCNEHQNQPLKYFCVDHKQILCVDCLTLNHRKCNEVVNLKEGYEKMQNEIDNLIKKIKTINENKKNLLNKFKMKNSIA
ncbi:tripartite motif-containing protein [Anaeramoeba flamelloides]|uniref:Tripartite motif-containing protein n=1 Tax=Anaeramoeba flamelloides TaxID=1746091 RepID=A0ABQ8XEP2_9EUKA|nr:tripartite motif-containing protein [Anaeramoeba flamelloides]